MQVFAAIAALGEFVKLAKELFTFIQGRIEVQKKEDVIKYITSVAASMGKLNSAKNTKERQEHAKTVALLTARLFK